MGSGPRPQGCVWQVQGWGLSRPGPGSRAPSAPGSRAAGSPCEAGRVSPHLHPASAQRVRGAHRVTPALAGLVAGDTCPFFFLIKKKSPGCISSRKTTLFSGSLISPLPNILFLRAGQPGPIETSSCHWLTSFPRLSTISSALNNLIKTTFWSERSNNYY